MDAERQKLAERILKLLALASGTTFEAEAETARKLAGELMEKHNLTGVDLDQDGAAVDRTRMVFEYYVPHFRGLKWEFILADAVAELCGCKAYWFGDYVRFTFVGLVPDVEACLYIVTKLHEQRIRDWLRYKKSGPDSFHKFSFGFAQGVADRIAILMCSMPALAAAIAAAKLWYEASHDVKHEAIGLGRASSHAGVAAGTGASLHRGEVGGREAMKLLR